MNLFPKEGNERTREDKGNLLPKSLTFVNIVKKEFINIEKDVKRNIRD